MSFTEAAKKTLLSYNKTRKLLKNKQCVMHPAENIHINTMFWKPTGKETKKIPILVISDEATGFTKTYVKEDTGEFLTDFLKELHKRFLVKNAQKTQIVAESELSDLVMKCIRRYMLEAEDVYEKIYLDTGKLRRINKKNIQGILDTLLEVMNKKAKIKNLNKPSNSGLKTVFIGNPRKPQKK